MTIETVDVGWCKEITDHGATQIAQSSKSLRYLGLMRCDQVSNICMNWYLLQSKCERVSVGVCVCKRKRWKDFYFPVQVGLAFTSAVTLLVHCVHIFH